MTDEAAFRALLAAVARRLDAAGRVATERPEDLLTAIAGSVVTALDAQAASIAVHDPATDRLVFRAAAGPAAGAVVGLSIDASAGIAGYAFTSGQPLAVADAPADPRFDRSVADATGYVPSSLLAVPLIDDAGTVGVLEALDRRGGSFTLRDLDVAGAIATTATIAVRSAAVRGDATAVLRASLASLMGDEDGADHDDATIDALGLGGHARPRRGGWDDLGARGSDRPTPRRGPGLGRAHDRLARRAPPSDAGATGRSSVRRSA